MVMRLRLRALVAAAVVTAVPISSASIAAELEAGWSEPLTAQSDATLELAQSSSAAALLSQHSEPSTTIRAGLALRTAAERQRKISVTSAKGRTTWTASSLAEHDVPSAAMRAYRAAARSIVASAPGCRLPWTLLAGIGRVESDHGRYGGSVLGVDGVPRPAIVGVALNGVGPVAAISDTDDGRFDGDRVWDRAVGPMQFIPSTWRTAGRDGDGDGVTSPNDIDDAALAAAGYLCAGGRDLAQDGDVRQAIFSYNPSDYYVDLVSAFARGYQGGAFVIPSPSVTPGSGDGVVQLQDDTTSPSIRTAARQKARHQARAARARAQARPRGAGKAAAARPATKPGATAKPKRPRPAPPRPTSRPIATPKPSPSAKPSPTSKPSPSAKPSPTSKPSPSAKPSPTSTPSPSAKPSPTSKPSPSAKPSPTSKPTPSPTPAPAKTVTGAVVKSEDGWTVSGVTLTPIELAAITPDDWDGDGSTEDITAELDGLAARQATVSVSYTLSPFKLVGFSLAP